MSAVGNNQINKAYIENLPHTPARKLGPVVGMQFMTALEQTYGEDKAHAASRFIFNQSDDTFAGTKAFKERFADALMDDRRPLLSVDDQKYIADIAHRVSLGIIQTK